MIGVTGKYSSVASSALSPCSRRWLTSPLPSPPDWRPSLELSSPQPQLSSAGGQLGLGPGLSQLPLRPLPHQSPATLFFTELRVRKNVLTTPSPDLMSTLTARLVSSVAESKAKVLDEAQPGELQSVGQEGRVHLQALVPLLPPSARCTPPCPPAGTPL